jgi:predicted kinase
MSSIVVVSGCPGSGKTTLSEALARSEPQGLHIPSDAFYGFPADPIDPTRKESHHQNTVIMRALGRCARVFAEGGYRVVVDGVIGPWFFPTLREELSGGPPVSYVVLRADEAEALRRVRQRQGPGASARVRHMVSAFSELGPYRIHAIETVGVSPEEVLAVTRTGLATGRFRLGWESDVAGRPTTDCS